MEFLPAPLRALNNYPQFVVYRAFADKENPGKFKKYPVCPLTRDTIGATDEKRWTTFEVAAAAAKRWGDEYGVGFCLSEKDPFFLLDIDNCINENDQLDENSKILQRIFENAAIEKSTSRRGLHIIGSGVCPPHTCNPVVHNMELYTEKRFIALTGYNVQGDAASDFSNILPGVVKSFFPTKKTVTLDYDKFCEGPNVNWSGCDDDVELIKMACNSKSIRAELDDTLTTFSDLWNANTDILAVNYPPNGAGQDFDQSAADLALAQHLAFWTGNDAPRMKNLMFESELRRDKYDRPDYLENTIALACTRQTQFSNFKKSKSTKKISTSEVEYKRRADFIELDDMKKIFDGCVYIADQHCIFNKNGQFLNPSQFQAMYSGGTFLLDSTRSKKTRNPWEAFISHNDYEFPKVHTAGFFPKRPYREISIDEDGVESINTYRPVIRNSIPGDVTLFLEHVKKLVPNKKDRHYLLSYLAAIVQYPGVKFQHALVLQGVDGNGKSFLVQCVEAAIGKKYSYAPTPALLTEKFNNWQQGKLFISVEDFEVPQSKMIQFIEALKAIITKDRIEIRYPGGTRSMKDVCGNLMFVFNNKSAIQKSGKDRRLMPIFTAQQHPGDLERDGMTKDYFTRLYHWAKDKNGYAHITYFLENYELTSDYNPADQLPAPITTSTAEAIQFSLGRGEQEILEMIERGAHGFKNGWVSSFALDRLLARLGLEREIPPKRRRELLQNLRYDWHPGLENGRASCSIMNETGKPKLYIHLDNPDYSLTDRNAICIAFEKAQIF